MIGWPVAHSLSPAIHNAAFAALGLDWVMVATPVAPEHGAAVAGAVRVLGLAGASVTMPHKQVVVAGMDELSADAAALDAVNCIVARAGRLIGLNTDGAGFLAGLRDDLDLDPAALRCAVLGAGGAARAVVRALALAGADAVSVIARNPRRADAVAALAGDRGRVDPLEVVPSCDLVVNATPVGMGTDTGSPLPDGLLRPDQAVVDLIYHPAVTPLLRDAERVGSRHANGLSMLVHQAALAFEAWTDTAAPLDAMRAAALAALGTTTT